MSDTRPAAAYRRIRSFVLRSGRMTEGQRQAYQRLWPVYGLDPNAGMLDFGQCFGNDRPVILEIGFGMGHSLVDMAAASPELNYLGVEVHRPGVGKIMQMMAERGIANIRICEYDAVEVLQHCIRDHSLAGVQIYFPDPWHKKKHHKRRLIQASFVALLARKLLPGGFVHLATDWEAYAEHMLSVMNDAPEFINQANDGGFVPRPSRRPLTKFERRGQRLNHGSWDLLFVRR